MVNGEWCLSAAHAGRLPFNAANAQRLFTIYHLLFTSDLSVSAYGQRLVNAAVRARDDVDADEFADAARGCGPGVGRGLDRRHVAAHDGGDEARADLLVADERDVGGLHHRVSRLDHRHQSLGLDHSQCFLRHSMCSFKRNEITSSITAARRYYTNSVRKPNCRVARPD